MKRSLQSPIVKWIKAWCDAWCLLEGPELEPRICHSHFLTAYHSGRALSRLGSCLQGKVIDIGAGTGHGARYLNPSATEYIPTDLPSGRSPLDSSISRLSHEPVLHCSIYELPFESASFNGALLLNVLEHFARPSDGLKELSRVLHPGALVLFCVPFAFPLHGLPDDYRRWTGRGLHCELESAGFEILDVQSCGSTFASLAININFCLRYELRALVLLMPLLILTQCILNLLALVAERFFPKATALPLVYVGLARKKAI